MASVTLPAGVDGEALQRRLYDEYRIEVFVASGLLRVSFAMYNDRRDLDRMLAALNSVLGR
jgi:selenocysteine lyase/cysteine desulfurase